MNRVVATIIAAGLVMSGCTSVCGDAADLCGSNADFSGECTGQLRLFAHCIVDEGDCSPATLAKCVQQNVLDDGSVGDDGGWPMDASQVTPHYFPQSLEKEVDLLFVIDNSGSMGEEQVNLTNNFPKLIEAMRSYRLGPDSSGRPCTFDDRSGCVIPNVHIGVISTDLGAGSYSDLPSCEVIGGDEGKLQNTPRVAGCTPPSDPYISYSSGSTNIAGADDPIERVKEAFTCIAKLGTDGCAFEQQLEAARRALDPTTNPGFVRPDAFLVVVFITDEDDCSAKNAQLYDPTESALTDPLGPLTSFRCFEFGISCDINDRLKIGPRKDCVPSGDWLWGIEQYVDFFSKLKPPGRTVVAAISGPTDRVEVGKDGDNPMLKESCQSAQGIAVPAIRIKALVDAFGRDGQFTSICEADFGPAMETLGKKIIGTVGVQCLSSPPLSSAGTAVSDSSLHEADCMVTELIGYGTAEEQTTDVAMCPTDLWYPDDWSKQRDCGATCPCWRLVKKPECDPLWDGSPYALDILRNAEPQKGTVAKVVCRGQAPGI